MSTNVPLPTLGLTGFLTQPDSAILAGVIADIQAAFGGALNLSVGTPSSLTTPQGQLASSITAMISDCYSQFLQIASQTDPQYAQGAMQDAIGNIYFMQRIPAAGTTVSATVLGLPSTSIGFGVAVAQDAAGNLYSCANSSTGAKAVIPGGGSLAVTFTNIATGATSYIAPMTIYQSTPGWSNITGATLLQLGQAVESQQAFEARRQASVAANSVGQFGSIKGAILAALASAGVGTSVYVAENPNSVQTTVGGVILPPNSVYIAVAAGSATNAQVASAIWKSKGNGCSYGPAPAATLNATVVGTALTVNSLTTGTIAIGQTLMPVSSSTPYVTAAGVPVTIVSGGGASWVLSGTPTATITALGIGTTSNTVVLVQDTSYAPPYPSYYPQWTVPTQVPIYAQVTIVAASLAMSASAAAALLVTPFQNAFTGADGGVPAQQIGATVFGTRFFSTVAGALINPQIVSVLVNTSNNFTNNPVSVPVNINQIPVYGGVSVVLV